MLGVTKLLCEADEIVQSLSSREGTNNGYAPKNPRLLQFAADKRPVVVWNITKRCNLLCSHCYSDSLNRNYNNELTTDEALQVIDDLSDFRVPVIIFSGGEPLLREDIFSLAGYAGEKGIRCVLSTNGVLIDKNTAKRVKDAGFSYAGISIDGIGEINDRLRGIKDSYNNALTGLRNLQDEDIYTGLRLTLRKKTLSQLVPVFELSENENVPRIYVSHLVYSGRGKNIKRDDLTHHESRMAVDFIINKAMDFHKRGIKKDVITGNNDADGVYLYLKAANGNPEMGEKIYELLKKRGGNSSGAAVSCIDHTGEVHADQFWSHYSFGNVLKRPFSDIWTDTNEPLMSRLKEKAKWIKGRCRTCRYLDICGGNYRVRAEFVHDDIWAEDPACYLTDSERGIG